MQQDANRQGKRAVILDAVDAEFQSLHFSGLKLSRT